METSKVVIYEKNKSFFEKIKSTCDELKLLSFPSSIDEDIEQGLTNFIGTTNKRSVLYIIEWDPNNIFIAEKSNTIFLFGITRKKKAEMEKFIAWQQTHPDCICIPKYDIGLTTSLYFRIPKLLKPRNGNFILSSDRQQTPTNNTMYDCEDCLANTISHQIITIWTNTLAGESVRACTGCGAQDGPWVTAQH